jgi:MFS family permease
VDTRGSQKDEGLLLDRRKDHRVRKSLRYSVSEGAFAAAMVGFGESFFLPYALLLKASTLQVGLISALPQAAGSLLQFFSNTLITRFHSRKRFVMVGALLQALMYIPMGLVFFLGEARVWHLLLFTCLYFSFGMMVNPAWNSWMGDLVVENRRGAYFGRRSKVTSTAAFFSLLAGGFLLRQFQEGGTVRQYEGFVLIFLLALACRLVSVLFLNRQFEPPYRVASGREPGWRDLLGREEYKNYRSFVLYLGLMNFAVFVSSPFFTPYMLHDLQMDYLTFTLVNGVSILVKVLSLPIWGRAVDRFGARRVMTLAGYLMPAVPLLWLFSGRVPWLIAVQVYSGFVWAAFEIATVSFIFDITTPEKRVTAMAYYNMINGVALIGGALVGSLVVRFDLLFSSPYYFAFLASGMLRLGASALFLPRLAEVRPVEDIGYRTLFFRVVFSVPTISLLYELIPFQRRELDE